MKCPVCTDAQLHMTERQGVEIDYCPQCRGVWLDRGELDKIIDRVAQQPGQPSTAPPPQPSHPPPPPPGPGTYQQPYAGQSPYPGQQPYRKKDDSDYKFRYPGSHGQHRHKKRGFLGEIFDFD